MFDNMFFKHLSCMILAKCKQKFEKWAKIGCYCENFDQKGVFVLALGK